MTVYDSSPDAGLSRRIAGLVALSRNDEACRLLGTDGVLEAQLDLTFIDDPLDWLAFDIATAIRIADAEEAQGEEEPGPNLAVLVAEVRLHRLFAGEVDEAALARKVRENLDSSE